MMGVLMASFISFQVPFTAGTIIGGLLDLLPFSHRLPHAVWHWHRGRHHAARPLLPARSVESGGHHYPRLSRHHLLASSGSWRDRLSNSGAVKSNNSMPIASLLDFWKRDRDTAPNLVAWQTLPSRPAQTHPFPTDLPAPVSQTLIAAGIHSLYSHQLEAWRHSRAGENIILSTGTASGKTLAYNLPVIAALFQDP